MLLEISFETEMKFIVNGRLLIRLHQFLKIYLSMLALLSKYPEWTEDVVSQCKSFIANIKGSYYNYTICSKVLFHAIPLADHIQ